MENPVLFDPPLSTYNRDDFFPGDADPLAIPPLDHAMFSGDLPFPDNFLDSDVDPDFNIEDLDFNLDDLLFDSGAGSNSGSTDHHSSLSPLPFVNSDQNSFFWSPEAEGLNPGFAGQALIVDVASNRATDGSFDDPRVTDVENGHNDRDSSGQVSSHDSHDGGCGFAKASNYQSLDPNLSHPSPESGSCDQIGSHGSRVSPSPDSFEGARAFSSSPVNSTTDAEKSKRKFEEAGSKCNPKRKKEQQEEGTAETRTIKFRKSSTTSENVSAENEGDDKKKVRLMRNRESAHLSRQRKKQYVEELEEKVKLMQSTIAGLNNRISYVMTENATLKQQLSGGGMCPPFPPHGMYPMAPMGYPWMPIPPPYAVKQGSQVPLVPIPRLKPQRPASAPKVSKKTDKTEKKKSEGKTKKLASISFLGLLFFMLLFGGLVPILNVRYGGIGGGVVVDRFSDVHRGKALMIGDGGKCYSDGKCGHEHGHYQEKHFGRIPLEEEGMLKFNSGTNGSVMVGNSSEPLVASLYVPRNDKLVRIDGNLIIHSVLASEKATVASGTVGQMKTSEETRLAIARNYIPTYHGDAGQSNGRSVDLDRDHTGRPKALGSSSSDDSKTPALDGRLQQWFLEDLAGPVLSSGLCTEVFQFDVTPSPGSIVPATSVANITADYRQNSTKLNRSSRRILRGHSIPLKDQAYNEEVKLQGNKSSSSIVVSVLFDPREVSDVESESILRPKTLSRIFVVVLIDSVKYVTYSCMLPLMGSSPHLVTA